MKKFAFTMLGIYAIILSWGFLLPRPTVERPEIKIVVVNPVLQAKPDTFVVESPDWVYPTIVEHSVRVTVYHAVEAQTDDSPDVLADGTRIDVSIAGSYRFCALSRDLLERWKGPYAYGDTIYVEGAGHLSGTWVVKDTMNKRFTNRVDLLVDVGTHPYSFNGAKIWKELI